MAYSGYLGNLPGAFFTFGGVDKTGKSTQYNLFVDRLERETGEQALRINGANQRSSDDVLAHFQKRTYGILATREPGGGIPAGEKIREIALSSELNVDEGTRLLLMGASRYELTHCLIIPLLRQGHTVVSDRWAHCSVAYQSYSGGVPLWIVNDVNHFATNQITPDASFIMRRDHEEIIEELLASSQRDATERVDENVHRTSLEERVALRTMLQQRDIGYDQLAQIANREKLQYFSIDFCRGHPEKTAEEIWSIAYPLLVQKKAIQEKRQN